MAEQSCREQLKKSTLLHGGNVIGCDRLYGVFYCNVDFLNFDTDVLVSKILK